MGRGNLQKRAHQKGPGPHCRVDGRFSSVMHSHDYADRCRADLSRRVYALPAAKPTAKERQCARWRADHKVVPDYSWGALPVHLQKRYKAYDCDSLVPPVPDAVPTGPTETVRRGWNRTAGSRYVFAADGVTFESTGGI